MPPDPRVHVGVAAVVWHPQLDDTLLLLKRAGQGEYASDGFGTWALPGGWLDFGETPTEAAAREVKEETGLDVSVDTLEGWSQWAFNTSENGQFQILTLVMHCRPNGSLEPRIMEPDKADAIEWVSVTEAMRRPLFQATADYLRTTV